MRLDEIYIRDPYILLYEDTYYMYGKKCEGQLGFMVYKSKDLIFWSEPAEVFIPTNDFWSDREFWAPEVHCYKSRFYMLASFKSESRCRGTQILVSDKPDGKFVPISKYPITPADWECLDGTLYIDRCGVPHMIFCHEWEQIGNGTVCEVALSDDLKTVISEPRLLWKASDYKGAVNARPHRESLVTDGPYMYRMKNNELICVWSSFGEYGYTVLIARSDNGDIDGKWKIDNDPLIQQDGGHGMIFSSISGNMYFVMHSPNVEGCERAKIFEFCESGSKINLKPKEQE